MRLRISLVRAACFCEGTCRRARSWGLSVEPPGISQPPGKSAARKVSGRGHNASWRCGLAQGELAGQCGPAVWPCSVADECKSGWRRMQVCVGRHLHVRPTSKKWPDCRKNAPTRIRTLDLLIKSQLLYQLSYRSLRADDSRQKAMCKRSDWFCHKFTAGDSDEVVWRRVWLRCSSSTGSAALPHRSFHKMRDQTILTGRRRGAGPPSASWSLHTMNSS